MGNMGVSIGLLDWLDNVLGDLLLSRSKVVALRIVMVLMNCIDFLSHHLQFSDYSEKLPILSWC